MAPDIIERSKASLRQHSIGFV